jgi:hypothetical protein
VLVYSQTPVIYGILAKGKSNVQVTAAEENVLSLTNKMLEKKIFF